MTFSVLILLLPLLFTQTSTVIFDLSWSGQIGDTIGGITAPFVGLVGSFLVYKAFLAQIEANKIQATAIQNQSRDKELDIAFRLLYDIDTVLVRKDKNYVHLHHNSYVTAENMNFYDFFEDWADITDKHRQRQFKPFNILIDQIESFTTFTLESPVLSERDKKLILEKATLTFITPIIIALNRVGKTELKKAKTERKLTEIDSWNQNLRPTIEKIMAFLGYQNNEIIGEET